MAPSTVNSINVNEDVIVQRTLDTVTNTSEISTPVVDDTTNHAVSRITTAITEIPSPAVSDILSSAVSDITTPATSVIATSPSVEEAAEDDTPRNDDSPAANGMLVSGTEHIHLRTSNRIRSTPKQSYQCHSKTRSHMRSKQPIAVRRSKRTNGKASRIQCQCSTELPDVFLQILERGPASISPDASFVLLQKLADYDDALCPQHSKCLTRWALTTMPYAGETSTKADIPYRLNHFDCTPSRRRASSVPDIMRDLPPAKKRRLATSTLLFASPVEEYANAHDQGRLHLPWPNEGKARPSHNSASDAEFRQHVLDQLGDRIKLKSSKPNSWGELNDRTMFRLVSSATQPNLDGDDDEVDAHFLSGEEAAIRLERMTRQLRIPIITCHQQQFGWTRGVGRPIEQFFRRMEGLDQMVSVQIPSLSIHRPSHSRMRLTVVKERFLRDDCLSGRWNLLDLGCSLPGILPNFLMGENCQLLPRIRDEVLRGDMFDRTLASRKEWN